MLNPNILQAMNWYLSPDEHLSKHYGDLVHKIENPRIVFKDESVCGQVADTIVINLSYATTM